MDKNNNLLLRELQIGIIRAVSNAKSMEDLAIAIEDFTKKVRKVVEDKE